MKAGTKLGEMGSRDWLKGMRDQEEYALGRKKIKGRDLGGPKLPFRGGEINYPSHNSFPNAIAGFFVAVIYKLVGNNGHMPNLVGFGYKAGVVAPGKFPVG